jgi:hypothetical protein
MNNPSRSDAAREPLAIDGLLTEDERRPLSVAGHQAFRESLSTSRPFDEIDELVAQLRETQPEEFDQ